MAIEKLQIVVDALWKGKNALDQAGRDLKKTQEETKKNTEGLRYLASQAASMGVALAAAGAVAKKTWDTIGEGEQVRAVSSTFDSLTASINTTSDIMIGKLRDATHGMVADFDLMQSSNRFVSMGLASTADEAANLSNIAVTLGSAMGKGPTQAMEEFALLLANQSIPRLDTFGISAGRVRTRIQELQEANKGMTRETAFMNAVMEEAGKSMTTLEGNVKNTVSATARMEAHFKNASNAFKEWLAIRWEGPIGGLADTIDASGTAWEKFVLFGAEATKTVTGFQGIMGPAANKIREEAAAAREAAEAHKAMAEAAALTEDEFNDLIPIIEAATAADKKFTNSQAYGTAELVDRTSEAVRGAAGIDAYRRGVEHTLTTEEAMAVAVANTNAKLAETPTVAEAAASLLTSVAAGAEGATRGVGGLNSALDVALGRSTELVTPLEEIFGALEAIENKQAANELIGEIATSQDFAAQKAIVLQEKLTGVYTGLQDTGSQADTSATQVNNYRSSLESIPDEVVTNIITNHIENYTSSGGAGQGGATSAAGGHRYASGADFIVPPGFPNDSFGPMFAQSGEHVKVTPAGQGGGSPITINITVNGGGNGHIIGRQIAGEVSDVLGRLN